MLDLLDAIESGAFDVGRGTIDGVPAWAWAMDRGQDSAIEAAIDQSREIGGHDAAGRSFLVACMDEGIPRGLVAVGLAKAAGEWWRPGPDGRDIFNHPGLDVSLANAIGQRLWAQGQWRRVHEYFGAWPVKGRRTRAGAMLLRWLPDNG